MNHDQETPVPDSSLPQAVYQQPMNTIKRYLIQYPLISSILLTLIFAGVRLFISPAFLGFFGSGISWVHVAVENFAISILLIWILVKMQWSAEAGLTHQISYRRPRWWMWALIFLIVELRLLLTVDWEELTFSFARVIKWLAVNISIGLNEELLGRGLIFYILYLSWGQTRLGLFKACLIQAALFSLGHYINVFWGTDLSVIHTQVIGTFFIGIAYGGIYLITRSIWPVVLLHTLRDAILFMNSTFGTAKLEMTQSINEDIIPFVIFNGVVYGIFGIICLLKSPLPGKVADNQVAVTAK